ncbi:hypothetical protein EVB32_063 [Rhizobium phage RHph_TM39]|uniref:Uncharacterized protein n=1 Tax=Rhizobium phage RHph_TM30 TaxID=2509764 RepID=A0A7S5RAR4_9CAUD|nr:hypothetical protein PQC16_gp063 [Rhizobium phage RHph_TM30]QIG71534.1 hypothetical protein EVB94_063 [Rhizobium phage RHph_TM40]QIG72259.1 hypothetical protein EVB96_063 [Rhizobium phage RHph_TM3_3_6]QIG77051.1 hypothetical protein EVB32_063 [Rhizobium phage RHph_TM39]QIG77390.1 hypothetical protein EVB61_062 [Rhizobium phage RHph_TM21B]QIG77650.1 hypothetical protein EVB64_063 [Rhizobium phage RHph_TM61]
MKTREEDLEQALKWTLQYIDAIPKDIDLPTMPGFDRDYVDSLLTPVIVPRYSQDLTLQDKMTLIQDIDVNACIEKGVAHGYYHFNSRISLWNEHSEKMVPYPFRLVPEAVTYDVFELMTNKYIVLSFRRQVNENISCFKWNGERFIKVSRSKYKWMDR